MADHWRHIPTFVRVAEAGSFVAAARALGVTASAVGKSIGALEQELGVQLLNRTTRAMRLTPEGQAFHARCRQAVDLVAEAQEEAASRCERPQGQLRVNVHSNLGRIRILPALPDFLARFPGLTLSVVLSPAALDLVNHEVDVVIRILEPPDRRVVGRHVGNLQFVTCAAPAYLHAHGTPASPDELTRHNCLRYILPEGARYDRWHFERAGRQQDVLVSGNLCIDDGHSLADNALRGLGIVHLLNTTVEHHIAQGRLVRLLPEWAAPGPPIYVMYRRSRRQPAKVSAFVEWVAGLFAPEAAARHPRRAARRARGRT